MLDDELHIVEANAHLAELLGLDQRELVGRPFESLLSVPARLLFQTHVFPALLAEGRVEEVLLTLAGRDGEAVPILLNAERNPATSDDGFVVLAVRIRARSRWEQDLLAATRALEAERAESRKLADELARAARDLESRHADDARSREFRDAFVGVVSHELRTPITTIYGMSHLLRQRHLKMQPADLQSGLEDIETEADRLRRLTEDLLVLSRAEGGRLEVADDPLIVGHVVRAAVQGERERSDGHVFELSVASGLPLVLGDSTYVDQVLRNYLSNAVKYSPAGSTVRTSARELDGGVSVTVTDEGAGLGDEPPDELWTLFYRTKDAIQQAGGAGIGLFVSKALIEAMGGRVWAGAAVEPPTGGAEFGFWLPAAPDPGEE